jgi:ferrous iron transport protein B
VLRNTVIRGEATPFVMELPPYRLPTAKGLMIHTWERAWQYIRKAGTVILAISILIWAGMTFPTLPVDRVAAFQAEKVRLAAQLTGAVAADADKIRDQINQVERQMKAAQLRNSVAGRIGVALEPITDLAGFDWRINIALVGGFAAKEVIIATLGTVYAMEESDTGLSQNLASRLRNDPQWTVMTGLSLVIFVMLYAPCFVTVVAMAKESAWKWALFSVVLNTLIAFCFSALLYQIGQRILH